MLQIYETLVVLDDDNKIEPQLAERWERSNELT
jgi:ABC-type transport system substrate-binding protein